MSEKTEQFLKSNNIAYKLATYDYQGTDATGAADQIGLAKEQIVKSMLVKIKKIGFAMLLLPCEMKISPQFAKENFNSKLRMATVEEVTNVTGYQIGTVCPFNLAQDVPIFIHNSLLEFNEVGIGSGKKGIEVILNPKEIKNCLKAEEIE